MAIAANIKNTKPKTARYIIKNPAKTVADSDYEWFETEDGQKIQGIIYLVGRNSKQFKDYIKTVTEVSGAIDYKQVVGKLIVGWDDNGFFDTPYSEDKVKELLESSDDEWLLDQLITFSVDNSNFF